MDKTPIKSDEEWQKELTPEQYEVLRRGGTEAPRDRIGHLAGEDAVGLPVGRLEGGQHQRARIGHRRAAHVVGEDGQCECGEQRSGIGKLHWPH